MADRDYYSFDEVLKDLKMEEDELKRLVSAGEIRAFRDRDTMRFKAEDIERIRADERSSGGHEIELDLGEELDLGADLDLDAPIDEGLVLEDNGVEEVDLAPGRADADEAAPKRRVPRSQVQAEPEQVEGVGTLFLLALGFVVLVFANFAALGAVAGRTTALTGFLADIFN